MAAAGAFGDEDDVAAVGRNNRHPVSKRVSRQLFLPLAVGGRDPNVHIAAGVRGVNQSPVGRPLQAELLTVIIPEAGLNLRPMLRVNTAINFWRDPDA